MDFNKIFVIDIETNSLLVNMLDYSSLPYKLNSGANLWCVVIRNVGTDEVFTAVKEAITTEWLREVLKDCTHLIAHNGIKFDFPALKLFNVFDYTVGYGGKDTLFGKPIRFLDSLILSRLLDPSRYSGHSLESWGVRVGFEKTDFRGLCIEKGYITSDSPRGSEFAKFVPEMVDYCVQDTLVNRLAFIKMLEELKSYPRWSKAITIEHKLADLSIKRESFGFYFDKPLALECLDDLGKKIQELHDKVDPLLPLKPFNKGELAKHTLPKNQFKKDGTPSSALLNRLKALDADLVTDDTGNYCAIDGNLIPLPHHEPLKTHRKASIEDLDHVKMFLLYLGWNPIEWKERDLTVDVKKQKIPYEKRIKALKKWLEDTLNGKYKKERLEILGIDPALLFENLAERLKDDRPVRVPTSPCVRVGVEKDLCPRLVELGDKVAFAKDFSLFLTYRHRKSCIAGGDTEEMDFDEEVPNTGYLSAYREVDKRIPTPAIEIGANTNRYKHVKVANVPRVSSLYGEPLRRLFGAGPGYVQLGFDFASLEARINGHYVWNYEDGPQLAATMLAEKPNDLHSIMGIKLGIPRSDAKSINYGIMYGAQAPKIAKMLNVDNMRAKEIYEDFWNAVPALKALKQVLEREWEDTGKKYIVGIDGRKIMTRSQHSLLNALFQSAGVICAKYVTVYIMEQLEQEGYNIDPFASVPDVAGMIEYHDECQIAVKPNMIKYKVSDSKESLEDFVSNWEGEQLGAIAHGKKWYIAMPNPVSRAISSSIERMGKDLNLNVPLGFEYIVGNNWAECH
jgi:hypothetical protein